VSTSSRSLVSTAEGTNRGAFGPQEWGLLATAGCVWGSSFFFIAEALEHFQPMLITWMRVVLGFCTMSLFPASRTPIDRADWKRVGFLGVIWMSIPLSMFPFAERRVSSSVTGMLNAAVPIFTAIVATVLLRRLPGVRQRWGLFVGTCGIVLIGIPSIRAGGTETIGVLMILFALSCYGVASNVVVPLQQKYGALPILRRVAGVASVLLAPFGIAGAMNSTFGWKALAANTALGVFGSALAFVALMTLAGRVGSTRASTNTYLIPVVALFLGTVVRGEDIELLSILGCVVVLIGAYLASRADVSNKPAVAATATA
jgi:drug/metabolite transporter (DMT)-like permease